MAESYLRPSVQQYEPSNSIQADETTDPLLTGQHESVPESGTIASGRNDLAVGSLPLSSSMLPQSTQNDEEYGVGQEVDPHRNYVPSQQPPHHPNHADNTQQYNAATEKSLLLGNHQGWAMNFVSRFQLWKFCYPTAKKRCVVVVGIVLVSLIVSLAVGVAIALPVYFTDPCSNIDNRLSVYSGDTVLTADIDPSCNKAASVSLTADNQFRQIVHVYQTDNCNKLTWYNTIFSIQPKHYSNISIPLLLFEHTDDISNYLSSGAHLNVAIKAAVTTANSLLYICLFDNLKLYLDFKDDWRDSLKLAKRCVTHNLNSTSVTVITEQFAIKENGYYFVAIATTAPQFDIIEYSYKGFSRFLNHTDYTYTNCELPDDQECRPSNCCALVYAEPLQPGEKDFSFIQVQASKLQTTAQERSAFISGPVGAVCVFIVLMILVIVVWILKEYIMRVKHPVQIDI